MTGQSTKEGQVPQFRLGRIAEILGAEIVGDENVAIKGVNSLEAAADGDIAFYFDPRYREALLKTKASAVIVEKANRQVQASQVVVADPGLAYAKVADLFAPVLPKALGISPQAVVHESCRIGKDVSIHPLAYVGEGALIGDEVILFPGVFIGDGVKIGKRTVVYSNVSILRGCTVGDDVIIHAGTTIGSDGFGFVREEAASVKIPQLGTVQIDDQVEIGANNCIDRATLGKTWIQRGVKTDNLVQVAHNVVIGEDTVVVAQAGIAGSVRIGREVIIGGQVGIADHLEVGEKAMIGSQAGVAKSVSSGEVVSGCPAIPHRLWLRTSGLIARLPQINERLRRLEKRLQELEADRNGGA
jgi:UDP-3-O-[3-hydroxymyristoyl] glucosamine N-acyltransferase